MNTYRLDRKVATYMENTGDRPIPSQFDEYPPAQLALVYASEDERRSVLAESEFDEIEWF